MRAVLGRAVRRLGFEPLFLALVVVAVPLGALAAVAPDLLDRAPGTRPGPATPPVAASEEWLVPDGPPPLETYWIMPITVKGGHAVGGVQRLEVSQGERVTIGVDTDVATTVSVQGYELWARVNPGDDAMLELTAFDAGRFRVEADGHLIGVLSVRPAWAGPAK